ncbi:MAG: ROK family protein [Spirochaetales bacterium]
MNLYGAIEAGGTKFVCGVASGPRTILEHTTIATRAPDTTLAECTDFFRRAFARHGEPTAFGIGSFGALDPAKDSAWYGHIRETPKEGWSNVDIAGVFAREFGVPVGFDTDVNAAALAEYKFGAGQGTGVRAAGRDARVSRRGEGAGVGAADAAGAAGVRSLVYVTVGTGVGGGAIADGHIVHGLLHPEMGHIPVMRETDDTDFRGVCPFHEACLEGLASGPAIQARWGVPATELSPEHRAWSLEARYLASFVVILTGILAPEVIVLGGGVMHVPGLIERVRESAQRKMNGYFPPVWKTERAGSDAGLDRYIVAPVLGDEAGLAGAVALAMDAGGA